MLARGVSVVDKMKNACLLPLLALGIAAVQAETAPSAEMKPVNVALFKNGYGFVTMQGTLPEGNSAELKPLPVPTLGTFWLEAGQGVDIARTVSSLRTTKEPSLQVTPSLLAASNPYARVIITLKGGSVVNGKILPIPRPSMTRNNPHIIGNGSSETLPPDPNGNILILTISPETNIASRVLVSPSEIVGFELLDSGKMPTVSVKTPVVTLELKKPAPGCQVRATCLAQGISWSPSYRLSLREDGTAFFEAKATVVNNLMDMDDVSLELITGFPSLEYAEHTDPMALLPNAMPKPLSARSLALMNRAPSPEEIAMDEESEEQMPIGGVKSEDLFFYPVDHFSAKADEVVALPLFSAEVGYEHIYTWDVPDPSTFADRSDDENNNNNAEETPNADVWHCIRMKNTLSVPLTKAPIEFMSQNRIAGQNTMPYTPPGGDCTIKMNKAVNVIADCHLSLVKREKYRNLRARDTYKTENEVGLSLENRTGKEIAVEIKQKLSGIVSQASDDAKTNVEVNFSDPENPSSTVQWTLRLKPGERKTVSYHYIYVD